MPTEITLFKKRITFFKTEQPTVIIAIAISEKDHENKIVTISCKEGDPVCQGVYDVITDSYLVKCASSHYIGKIPFSYEIQVDNIANWSTCIPIPDNIFSNHLKEVEKQKLQTWRTSLPKSWKIQYLQIRGVY